MPNNFVINEPNKISRNKKLIDLNRDFVNFEAEFSIDSDYPFEFTIVNQATLDNAEKINYNKTQGNVSDKIRIEDNDFQNYFLVIKNDSQEEKDANIRIRCQELPKSDKNIIPTDVPKDVSTEIQRTIPKDVQMENFSQPQSNEQEIHRQLIEKYTNSSDYRRWMIIGAGILFLVLALYFYFKKNKSSEVTIQPSAQVIPQQPIMQMSPQVMPQPIIQPIQQVIPQPTPQLEPTPNINPNINISALKNRTGFRSIYNLN
jgi:hypothetical protein